MKRILLPLAVALAAAPMGYAQQVGFDRLSPERLNVSPPSARVTGAPGEMRIAHTACPNLQVTDVRRRIVDIAVQEWGFFGFNVVDQTIEESEADRRRRRGSRLSPELATRVADSIAGYWAITSDGGWILERQNRVWRGPWGITADWRDPWSAAFVSWVMCEAGFAEMSQFHRAIAHHRYIDQAIAARGDARSETAFVAYNVGEMPIEPGDLLCSARRSVYRTIDERRDNLGMGIRSHCDIVIQVDPENDRILGIGGNVRDSVSLKLLPTVFGTGSEPSVLEVGQDRRKVFAHLKLRAESIGTDVLESSPTIEALGEHTDGLDWLWQRLQGGRTVPSGVGPLARSGSGTNRLL